VKSGVLLATVLALAGCNRGIDNKEAVRQGVVDYLANRTNLNVASMNVDVTSVTFKGNEAEATVSFAPKGSGGGAQGMSMRYALERQGNRWVVKGRPDKGAHGGEGMPGGMPPGHGMQGSEGAQPPAGQMPPGHPAVPNPEKK
jgi:hypothetical protein